MRSLVLFAAAVVLQAQTADFRYVELSIRGAGAAVEARNAGGEVAIAAAAGELRTPLSDALVPLRWSADGQTVVGAPVAGANFHLFIAVAKGANAVAPSGRYTGAYFGLHDGAVVGLTTAMLDFTSDGAGRWEGVVLNGHTSARDDVNREERPAVVTYSMGADGVGVVRFPVGSDLLSGDRDFMTSADGSVIIGYSRGADRDLFVAVRWDAERGAGLLSGLYGLGELTAETPFAFDAAAVRFSAANGLLRADGVSRATIAERLIRQRTQGTAATSLVTANTFYASSFDAAGLVRDPNADRRTNNLHFNSRLLVGAHVGVAGEATLEHGLWVGVRAATESALAQGPVIRPSGVVNAADFSSGVAAALGYMSIFGSALAPSTAVASGTPLPAELAGTRVLVNGQPAPLHFVSPGQVNVQWPTGDAATVQVSTAAGVSNVVSVAAAAASPGVLPGAVLHADFSPVTPTAPARPGETLIVYAIGLGAVSPAVAPGAAAGSNPLSRTSDANLRVMIAGVPAIVEFSGLAAGYAGLYQLNVRVPDEAQSTLAAPVAIALSDAFTDIAEIPVVR